MGRSLGHEDDARSFQRRSIRQYLRYESVDKLDCKAQEGGCLTVGQCGKSIVQLQRGPAHSKLMETSKQNAHILVNKRLQGSHALLREVWR